MCDPAHDTNEMCRALGRILTVMTGFQVFIIIFFVAQAIKMKLRATMRTMQQCHDNDSTCKKKREDFI